MEAVAWPEVAYAGQIEVCKLVTLFLSLLRSATSCQNSSDGGDKLWLDSTQN